MDIKDKNITVSNLVEKFISAYDQINNNKIDIYIDCPFCVRICEYCCYAPRQLKNKEDFENYKDFTEKMLKEFKPVFELYEINSVYFGGGTAGLYTVKDLEKFMSYIPNFDMIKEKRYEFSPQTLTKEKIDFLIEHNFHSITIGIQTFSNEILKKQNRLTYNEQSLYENIKKLQKNKIYVNFDFLAFMNYSLEDLKLLKIDLIKAMTEYKVDHITIYPNYFFYDRDIKEEKIAYLFKKTIAEAIHSVDNYIFMDNTDDYSLKTLKKDRNYPRQNYMLMLLSERKSDFLRNYTSDYFFINSAQTSTVAIGGYRINKPVYGSIKDVSGYNMHVKYEDGAFIETIEIVNPEGFRKKWNL